MFNPNPSSKIKQGQCGSHRQFGIEQPCTLERIMAVSTNLHCPLLPHTLIQKYKEELGRVHGRSLAGHHNHVIFKKKGFEPELPLCYQLDKNKVKLKVTVETHMCFLSWRIIMDNPLFLLSFFCLLTY